MKLPEWTKPALVGAGIGAVVLAIWGFSYGGWVTGGSAQKMADMQTQTAVATVLTPYCVLKAQDDPNRATVQEKLDAASSYQRQGILEDAGWATPMGGDKPNHELAKLCLNALQKQS